MNSALVSAQQRKRLYWTNIGNGGVNIIMPEDRGILLKDVLESGFPYQDKSHCITARYSGAAFHNSVMRNKNSMIAEPIALKEKSQTICAQYRKVNADWLIKRNQHGLMCVYPHFSDGVEATGEERGAALRTRNDENGSFKRLEVRGDGKGNALTTVLTDSVVCTPVRVGHIGKGGQGHRIYSVRGKTVSLTANGGGAGAKTGLYKIDLPDGDYTVRKLTPIEAERCQTLPDNYTAYGVDDNGKVVKVSDTQRYKAVGNGWTVDVIAHIFNHMD
jgi:DNA (cytosine-5)-methyltransferase 3A